MALVRLRSKPTGSNFAHRVGSFEANAGLKNLRIVAPGWCLHGLTRRRTRGLGSENSPVSCKITNKYQDLSTPPSGLASPLLTTEPKSTESDQELSRDCRLPSHAASTTGTGGTPKRIVPGLVSRRVSATSVPAEANDPSSARSCKLHQLRHRSQLPRASGTADCGCTEFRLSEFALMRWNCDILISFAVFDAPWKRKALSQYSEAAAGSPSA